MAQNWAAMSKTLFPDIVEQLREAGFELARHGKGAHMIFRGPGGRSAVVSHNIKSPHLARKILKQAGIC